MERAQASRGEIPGEPLMFALLSAFFRSFFLQTLWNYERMQNWGFAFSMAPLLKRIFPDKERFGAALRRETQFFNTHPYFAPVVMGVLFWKEKERMKTEQGEDPTLPVLKDTMGGAFGAIGDHVIWGTWRPFCAVLALAIGLLVAFPSKGPNHPSSIFDAVGASLCARWWVAGFLAIFNCVHLWLRWRGLHKAAVDGPQVVKWVQSLHLQTWAAQIRRIGLLLLVFMVMVYLSRWTSSPMLLWMVAVLLGSVILKRWGMANALIFYGVCGVSFAMTFIGIQGP